MHQGKPSVRWRTLAGKQRLRRCPNLRAAKQLASKITYLLSQGIDWDPAAPQPEDPGPTDLWRVVERYTAIKVADMAPTTQRLATIHLEKFNDFLDTRADDWHVYHDGAAPPVTMLSLALLEDYWIWLPNHTRCKPHVRADYVEIVERMWIWAEESDRWPDIPRPRRKKDLPKPPKPDPVAATYADWSAMLAELSAHTRRYMHRKPRSRSGDYDPLWTEKLGLLVYYTAMRKTAALSIEWSAIDFEQDRINVRAEITKGGYGGRVLPLHPDLRARLAAWGVREGRIIKAPPAEYPPKRGHAQRNFNRAWKRAGVPPLRYKGHPIHGARHTIETEWAVVGVAQRVIDMFTGHANQGTGERNYRERIRLWPQLVKAVATIPAVRLPDEEGYTQPDKKVQPLRPDLQSEQAASQNTAQGAARDVTPALYRGQGS
ncbi:MAG: tyrosine-type recombinase/integrase [Myxococcota bacterium]